MECARHTDSINTMLTAAAFNLKRDIYPWATYLLVNAMAKKPLKDTSQHHYALVSKVYEPIRSEKNVGLLMTEANNAI